MTRKNAKKQKARARQEKTGQSYASALRSEGTEKIKLAHHDADKFVIDQHARIFDEKECKLVESVAKFNGGNSHVIVERQAIRLTQDGPAEDCYVLVTRHRDGWEPTDKFRHSWYIFPEALEVLRRLPPLQHRDHKPANMTDEERDNLVAQAIQEMGPEEFWRRVREARQPTPPPLRGWGLEDDAPGGFTPKKPLEGFEINRTPGGGFDHTAAIASLELPEEVRRKRPLYERFYKEQMSPDELRDGFTELQSRGLIKKNIDPQKLMAYWADLPEAKRIIDSKQRLLGVTDDHPEKPLITWTLLTQVKECPEDFGAWWEQLPESQRYDRARHDENPWRMFAIDPGDTEATWVEAGPSGKVQDSPLIRKFKGIFPKTLPSGPMKVHVKFCLADGSCWGQDHDLIIPTDEIVRGRYQTIQRAFELLRKECRDSSKTPDPDDIRFVSFAMV